MYCAVLCSVTQSCMTLSNPTRLLCPWDSHGKNTGVGCHALLQGIFLTQGSNPGLPHCKEILYQLSHKGSPRILEWVAYPFSSGSSQPRTWTRVSCIAGGFCTNWAIREAQVRKKHPSQWKFRKIYYLQHGQTVKDNFKGTTCLDRKLRNRHLL